MDFESPMELFDHVKEEHILKGVTHCQWEGCGKVATLRSNLVSHMNKHITINTDVCYVCDRQFRWKGDYTRHNRKHTVEQRRFNTMANLLFTNK